MVHLADLFSVPEMGLLCNVAEYFIKNHIDYHPEILFLDVKVSLQFRTISILIIIQSIDILRRPRAYYGTLSFLKIGMQKIVYCF